MGKSTYFSLIAAIAIAGMLIAVDNAAAQTQPSNTIASAASAAATSAAVSAQTTPVIAKTPPAADSSGAMASPPKSIQTAAVILDRRAVSTDDGMRLYDETRDGSETNPMSWSLHVYKSRHLLEVFYKGHLFKTYHAVFGRSQWAGAKTWEGDGRTPEGSYLIVAKHRSQRFRWFLKLNYPNAADEVRFQELRAAHEIPAGYKVGGQVGIHGTELSVLNSGDINWTTGCISVDNTGISELARLLPIGTLVVINP
jgi:lipoprotein-anchoring transpeptidase ErfK/SrfK